MSKSQFVYKKRTFLIPFISVAVIWVVYFIEINFGYNFNKFGIYPMSLKGLRGIIFSPFVHSDFRHLFNNSVPLFVMLGCLYFFYRDIAFKVLFSGILLTGIFTWFIARPSYHIGASGVVYFLVSFIFFSGVFRKYYRLVALSLAVVFLYGSMIWYIFPVEERISWEGHLSGFVVGFIFAFIFKNLGPKPEVFQFSSNKEFEDMFDEDGNFIVVEDKEEKDVNNLPEKP